MKSDDVLVKDDQSTISVLNNMHRLIRYNIIIYNIDFMSEVEMRKLRLAHFTMFPCNRIKNEIRIELKL